MQKLAKPLRIASCAAVEPRAESLHVKQNGDGHRPEKPVQSRPPAMF
jgi:hypothetical protein